MVARPLGPDELRREGVRQLFARLMQFRTWLTPFRIFICLALAAVEDVPWRRAVFLLIILVTTLATLVEGRRFAIMDVERQRSFADAALNITFFLVIPFSGGVESPFLAQLVLGGIVGAFMVSHRLARRVEIGIAVIIFALAAAAVLSPRIGDFSLFAVWGHHTAAFYLLTAVGLTVYVFVGRALGVNIRGMTEEMLARSIPILTVWEQRRIKRAGYTASLNIVSMSSLLLLLSTATGALESPFLLHLTVAWVMGAFLIPRRVSFAIATLAVSWMWTMAFLSLRPGAILPRVFLLGPPDHPRVFYFFCAILQTVNVLACRQLGVALRGIVEEMVERSFANRDEMLRAHAERTTELVTLSGQIAHELEQPLAHLESLAAVIEAEVEPARAAAQLASLQAEVARMQAILEEFLNFSRPLVPLTIGPVDLGEVVSDVGYLHEGLAAERHVALKLPEDARVEVRCDARKVKQILINLVQNALSVSPAGSAIVVELARADGSGQAMLRVCDRGPGVPAPAPTERGLGYTIVRALAEQHGGSFHVEARAGGGCVAELLLPIDGPAARV